MFCKLLSISTRCAARCTSIRGAAALSTAPPDPWSVLRIRREASDDEVKQAYRERALETHPDCGGNADDFKLVARAFACLAEGGGGEAAFHCDGSGSGRASQHAATTRSSATDGGKTEWTTWSQRDAEALFRSLFGEKVEFAEYSPFQAVQTVNRARAAMKLDVVNAAKAAQADAEMRRGRRNAGAYAVLAGGSQRNQRSGTARFSREDRFAAVAERERARQARREERERNNET